MFWLAGSHATESYDAAAELAAESKRALDFATLSVG